MASWRADVPHDNLAPPPGVDILETRRVLKAAIGANSALAQLSQATALIPNPAILFTAIPLLEAQASSEIENIVTTADELFRHADDEAGATAATRETLRYRAALQAGVEQAGTRGVTAATAAMVCGIIHGREMGVRALPGTRIANPTTGEIRYSPPEGRDRIREKLSDWERFVHGTDGMDPLVRMAAAHYHFEAIHPFSDGNGRTGRILNVLLLVEAGLLSQPVLYLSRYVIDTKADYYRLLQAVSAEDAWEDWLLYMLKGVEHTSRETLSKIEAIRDLQARFIQRARGTGRGMSNAAFQSVLFELPYVRIHTIVERCGVSRPTATAWLSALADVGLLDDVRVGRDRLFINRELLDVLIRREP